MACISSVEDQAVSAMVCSLVPFLLLILVKKDMFPGWDNRKRVYKGEALNGMYYKDLLDEALLKSV